MIKINYKSDFKINEKSETIALEVPFVFSYYVFDSKKYVVSFDGHNYVNCERKEDGSLDIIFNNPNLGVGHLKVERKYAVDDKAFADGVFDIVTVEKTDVFITSGKTFESYVESLVVPPYIKGDKGDPMTWSTMTETEREELVHDVAEAIDPEMVMTENEKSRQEAEQGRQKAEQQRSTTFNTLKGEMQSAITAGNAAAGNAQKVVNEYDTKVSEQDSKLSELGQEVDDFKEAVTNQVNNYKPIEINGNVTNAADEEDITSDENNLLKLKNRNNLNGMGYVILRKDKPFKEQLIQSNTIYEIRYDFDLGGAEVTIPENCVIEFKGGSLRNGGLIGQSTDISSYLTYIFKNIRLSGTFSKEFFVEWFGAKSNGTTHNDIYINYAIEQISRLPSGGTLVFTNAYIINDTLYLKPGVTLRGVKLEERRVNATAWGCSSIMANFDEHPDRWIFDQCSDKTIPYYFINLEGLTDSNNYMGSVGLRDLAIFNIGEKWIYGGIRMRRLQHDGLRNITIEGTYVGISLSVSWGCLLDNIFLKVYRFGIVFGQGNTGINSTNIYITRADKIPTSNGNTVEIIPDFDEFVFREGSQQNEEIRSTLNIPYLQYSNEAEVSNDPFICFINGEKRKISVAIVIEHGHISNSGSIFELFDMLSVISKGQLYMTDTYLEQISLSLMYIYEGRANLRGQRFDVLSTSTYEFGIGTTKAFIEAEGFTSSRIYYATASGGMPNFLAPLTARARLYYNNITSTADGLVGSNDYSPMNILQPTVRLGYPTIQTDAKYAYLDGRLTTGLGTTTVTFDEVARRQDYNNIRCLVTWGDISTDTDNVVFNKIYSFFAIANNRGGFKNGNALKIANCHITFENISTKTGMLQIYGDNTIVYSSVTPSVYQGTVKPFTLCGRGNYELTVYIHTTDNASWSKLDNIVTNANEFYSPFKILIINTYPGKEARMELTNPNRPTENLVEGFEYYDSTLKKKILWNGTEWTNLDGSALS